MTLVELLVVTGILGCLGWMLLTGLARARASSHNVQCVSNLRQIHQAMMLYSVEHQCYPSPNATQTLKDLLKPWLGQAPAIFHCPEDGAKDADSYSYFYAPRSLFVDVDNYILGCPRHQGFTRGVVLYAGANTVVPSTSPFAHDQVRAAPAQEFDSGTFEYADGSVAFISMGLGNGVQAQSASGPSFQSKKSDDDDDDDGHGASSKTTNPAGRPVLSTLLSIQRGDGTWYTVVRIKPGSHGTVSFSVIPGNRFDVITETAVIAVRGTQFSVETKTQGGKVATQVEVTAGVVEVESATSGKPIRVDTNPGKNRAIVVEGQPPAYN